MNTIKAKKFKIFNWSGKKLRKNLNALLFITIFSVLVVDALKFRLIVNKFNDVSSMTFDYISYPVSLIQSQYYNIKDYFITLDDKQTLIKENQKLRILVKEIELIRSENNDLKNLVNLQDNFHFSQVSSRVVMQFADNFDKRYLLNIGKINGVKIGNAVVKNNEIIGKVVDVSDRSAKVKLVTDKQVKIPVAIIGTPYTAIISGSQDNRHLKLLYLPYDAEIEEGSAVVTSGEEENIPYGINVGKIRKINNEYLVSICAECNKPLKIVSVLKLKENFADASKKQ